MVVWLVGLDVCVDGNEGSYSSVHKTKAGAIKMLQLFAEDLGIDASDYTWRGGSRNLDAHPAVVAYELSPMDVRA